VTARRCCLPTPGSTSDKISQRCGGVPAMLRRSYNKCWSQRAPPGSHIGRTPACLVRDSQPTSHHFFRRGQFNKHDGPLGTNRIWQALHGQATYSSCWVACARSRLIPSGSPETGPCASGSPGRRSRWSSALTWAADVKAAHAAFGSAAHVRRQRCLFNR
jgi:hypothetical protein